MGMNDIGALGDEWDMEAYGDIPSYEGDAVVVQEADISDVKSDVIGADAASFEVLEGQNPIAGDADSVDELIVDGTYLPKELLDKIADAAQEVAAFLEVNPQEEVLEAVYDYGEDFAPV